MSFIGFVPCFKQRSVGPILLRSVSYNSWKDEYFVHIALSFEPLKQSKYHSPRWITCYKNKALLIRSTLAEAFDKLFYRCLELQKLEEN